jgi:hypothetical protein
MIVFLRFVVFGFVSAAAVVSRCFMSHQDSRFEVHIDERWTDARKALLFLRLASRPPSLTESF